EEFFLAIAGNGATRNGLPIATSPGGEIAGARVGGPQAFLERLAAVAPAVMVMPRVHSLALRLARVADGTLDAAFASHTSPDSGPAAADLLVHEAGGALTTTGGVTLAYNGATTMHDVLVAAGRARHQALIAL